ncbi:hypothetical protein RHSIM_Rhsim02G0111900 [Rhododendron simsii]|uniref:SUI1 domain-containing protein n=1 Tax=Rhododendron simsii TaxID=118357 RepID=A0A834HBT6_RHOSS|nr:hypothetical protein RHSIM_Rhsim02G0111900 [Rhododendron simsii]
MGDLLVASRCLSSFVEMVVGVHGSGSDMTRHLLSTLTRAGFACWFGSLNSSSQVSCLRLTSRFPVPLYTVCIAILEKRNLNVIISQWLIYEIEQAGAAFFRRLLSGEFSLLSTDPFAEANAEDSGAVSKEYVHIRTQQRNGRKSLTTVQGLKKEFSYNKILKDLKKEFCCNGTVVQDPELGQVIQLQGDQRKNVSTFLVQAGIVKKEHIKIHGF